MLRQEFEWLTSNTTIAYPFVERVANPSTPTGPDFSNLVVDAFLTYPEEVQKGIRLHSLTDPSGLTPAVEFRYDDNTVAFSGGSVRVTPMGPWLVLEWTSSTQLARLLLKTDAIAQYTWPALPANAWLVGHALQPIQTHVKSLTAELNTFSGTVELVAGYNVRLTNLPANDTTARGISQVVVDVQSGEGLGQYPTCSETTTPIMTINGVAPDAYGNYLVRSKECYRSEIPVSNPTGDPFVIVPNTLKLYNDCSPCCSCDDYVQVYDSVLRNLYTNAKKVSDQAYYVRDQLQSIVDRWKTEKECREEPTLEVRVTPIPGWLVGVQMIVRNNGKDCSMDLKLAGTIKSCYAEVVPNSARIDGDTVHAVTNFEGGWPSFSAEYSDGIRGARTVTLSFWLYMLSDDASPPFQSSASSESPQSSKSMTYGSRQEGSIMTITVSGTLDTTPLEATGSCAILSSFNRD